MEGRKVCGRRLLGSCVLTPFALPETPRDTKSAVRLCTASPSVSRPSVSRDPSEIFYVLVLTACIRVLTVKRRR